MSKTVSTVLSLLFVAFVSLHAAAADKKSGTFTDPKNAGPEYAVQGEYEGKIGDGKAGVQVIALGGGKYHVVSYPGGLPGDGWKRGDEKHEADLATKDGVVSGSKNEYHATIKDGVFTLSRGDEVIGTLKKVTRKSKTLGAKPPKGAVVLFGGKSVENFEGGHLSKDGYLLAGTHSKQKFGDSTLHVEFRTPFKPAARGQGRGNSGVYVQSRYELQVLDSFGLEGKNNECGGFYSISEPDVNMCFPPLTWQTYDIDFTAARYEDGKKVKNARVTVKHNGVVIHKDLELPRGTPGRLREGPGPAPVYLQGHGNPVVFRNIWIVPKK